MKKQLKSYIYNLGSFRAFSLTLILSLFVLYSCQDENIEEITGDTVVLNEEEVSGINPPSGCNPSVAFNDLGNGTGIPQVPFYANAVLFPGGSQSGSCTNPAGTLPCAFIGHVVVNSVPGMTGDYRVVLPNGAIRKVSGQQSFKYVYGETQTPTGLSCGYTSTAYIQAQNPTNNQWVIVATLVLNCSLCVYSI